MSVKKYCYSDNNCKYETLDKEEILAAITQAVNEGTIGDIDTGFITTIKTINGTPLKFFVGEQSAYDVLSDEQKENLFAIITNDENKEALFQTLEELQKNYTDLREGLENGNIKPNIATNAHHLVVNEKFIGGVSTAGVTINDKEASGSYFIEEGKTYLISEDYTIDSSLVGITHTIYIPSLTGSKNIFRSSADYLTSRLVQLEVSTVGNATIRFLYNNEGPAYTTASNVFIRKI